MKKRLFHVEQLRPFLRYMNMILYSYNHQKKGPKMKLLVLLLVLPALLFGGTPRDHQIAAVEYLNKRDVKLFTDLYYATPAAKLDSARYYAGLFKKHPLMRMKLLDCTVIMESPTEAHVLGAIFTSKSPRCLSIWVYEETLILKDGKWLATSTTGVDYFDMTESTWSEAFERCRDKYGLDIGD